MHLETRMLCQPCLDLLGLVGPVVVANQVHIEMPGHCCIDLFEEAEEFFGPVTRHAFSDDRAGLNLRHALRFGRDKRSEKGGDAVALIVMGHGSGAALLHGQAGLGAIKRLYLVH